MNKIYSGFLVDWTINSGKKHDSNDSVVASGYQCSLKYGSRMETRLKLVLCLVASVVHHNEQSTYTTVPLFHRKKIFSYKWFI